MPPQIAILGAGIFVRTQYIPRLREIGDCVMVKAIWSRSEVTDMFTLVMLHSIYFDLHVTDLVNFRFMVLDIGKIGHIISAISEISAILEIIVTNIIESISYQIPQNLIRYSRYIFD